MIDPCPECKQPISSLAKACPHCGLPKLTEPHARLHVDSVRRVSAYKGVRVFIDVFLLLFVIGGSVAALALAARGAITGATIVGGFVPIAIINSALANALLDIADALLKRERRDAYS